ncbi:hypothetical protein HGM15179_019492 [Zosterops borbonicus]|uniref:Peptidase A2 domain-containing protein n=1 Tax=Zosterops borbonicus TaxID=364589 RepID=A0A8K1FY55_9PASS|nr:hypothetical protein HGM15179_019492 [Zosterops borbonicus]
MQISTQEGRNLAGKREAERNGEVSHDTNALSRPQSGDCLDLLVSTTSGGARVDLQTGVDVSLTDATVQVVPSMANGPLGHGLSALLIGRSSTSKQGIFVLPGLIDADYMGNIGIMLQAMSLPVYIPKGTRLAKLIPFRAQVPRKGASSRGDGGFGSTGTPQVMFTMPLSKDKPIKPMTFQHPGGETLGVKAVLLDTSADATIIPSFAWPDVWPLTTLGTPVLEVGGMQMTQVSESLLTVWVDNEARLCPGEHLDAVNLLPVLQRELQTAGLQIAPEKVQQQAPWKYLGMINTEAQIFPQKLTICTEIRTLTDAQKLIRDIQWIRTTCGITNEDLEPLMPLLKGSSQANLWRELTEKQQKALTQIATKLGNSFADHWSPALPLSVAVLNKEAHVMVILMQWNIQAKQSLKILE